LLTFIFDNTASLPKSTFLSIPFYFCFKQKKIMMCILKATSKKKKRIQKFSSVRLPRIFLVATLTFVSAPLFRQSKLTIEDIWSKYAFAGNSVEGFSSMKDGEHFSAIEEDGTGNQNYLIYSYSTGKVTDTIVRGKELIPPGFSQCHQG
jgi:hypothetical protein